MKFLKEATGAFITTATEKRVESASCEYDELLRYLLDAMKSREGCSDASIKEMQGWGINLPNACQIRVYGSQEMNGLCYLYNDYIRYTGTHDLSHVDIDDFNGLVKAVIAGTGQHNPYKA